MAKFKVCEFCGDHLDFGERCDCRSSRACKGTGTVGKEVAVGGTEECYAHQRAVRNYPQARIELSVLGRC